MVYSSVWSMCLAAVKSFEILGGTLVSYSGRSPRLWINNRFLCLRALRPQQNTPFQPNRMWETIEPTWLSVFVPFVLFCPPTAPFVFFAPLFLKIAPKEAIPPTLRTTGLTVYTIACKPTSQQLVAVSACACERSTLLCTVSLRQRFPTCPEQDFWGCKMRILNVSVYVLGCTSFTVEPRFMKTCKPRYSKEHYPA